MELLKTGCPRGLLFPVHDLQALHAPKVFGVAGNQGHAEGKGRSCDPGVFSLDSVALLAELGVKTGPLERLLPAKGENLAWRSRTTTKSEWLVPRGPCL